jgi:hypothetical protein
MKDKDLNLEEIEVSHTLGEGRVQGRGGEDVDTPLVSNTLTYMSLTDLAQVWGLFR